MDWLVFAAVGVIAVAAVNSLMAKRRLKTAKDARVAAAAATGDDTGSTSASTSGAVPSTWGWAKVHWREAGLKALGHYYRDRAAGPSFKVFVDLLDDPSDDAIALAASEKKYVANSTFRLGAHETLYAGAREGQMGKLTEQAYAKGEGAAGPHCAVVMMLTADEKRAYDLPPAMPHIELYLG